jgi:hypothetical protein
MTTSTTSDSIAIEADITKVLPDKDFESYYTKIRLLQLPLNFDCHNDSSYFRYFNYNKSTQTANKKYANNFFYTYGRLNLHENIISIIYMVSADFYYPLIYSYKLDGSIIDSLNLYSGASCDGYPGHWSHSVAIIDGNKIISSIDTAGTYELNAESEIINGSDSIIVSTYKFEMTNSGHFKKIFEQKTQKLKLR